ncbi:ribosome-binding factor A [Rubricella aquisinus]|uniref:Ribosome-binding factor A n=1 Tax=Rubricella aquisinus TaxID=2028108 RepID=A0A840WQ58_9RHOB|nr:30S ribosome-binding factor RbfA [Rubricella aquisinus]MBB5517169.1 ribosome-binding factor A [Rubricella aquisinus]
MAKNRSFEGAGPSQRQLRVGEVIRRALSDIFLRGEIYDDALSGVSITVGEVVMTSDLRLAKVYVLPLGGGEADTVVAALERRKGEIRRLVNRSLTLKHSPELTFLADKTFDQMEQTRALLAQDAVRRDVERPDDE